MPLKTSLPCLLLVQLTVALCCSWQARAEALGGLLAAVGVVTPSLEQLLKERQPGRGRLAATEAVEGATRVFALSSTLSDSAKQVGLRAGNCAKALLQCLLRTRLGWA